MKNIFTKQVIYTVDSSDLSELIQDLYDINPENALERTNRKFTSRFNYLESKTISIGKDLKQMTLAEMDVIWEEAKKNEAP